MISGLILSGVEPVRVRPNRDGASVHESGMAVEQGSVFHLRGDRVDPGRARGA